MQDKLENNYSVYQHVTPDGMHYFGQTQNVEQRWRNNGAGYKETALYPYIEKFGWNNIQHIVLFENQSKEDALKIEDSLIISGWEKGNCINKRRSGNIRKKDWYRQQKSKQYYEQNKQQIRGQHKQYYEENKQQILEQKQQYYEENKDKKQQYYEENKQQRREYQRQYYQRKKKEKQFKEFGCLPLF